MGIPKDITIKVIHKNMRFLVFIVLLSIKVYAVYFKVSQSAPKCFLEEVPEDTLVVGHYTSLDHQPGFRTEDLPGSENGIMVQVEDPLTKAVLMRHWTFSEGKFAFTSLHGGEHKICLQVAHNNWFESESPSYRFTLHLDVGEAATDYEELAKVEHLSAIEVEIRKLNDRMRSIRNEQNYQKLREVEFRDTSESTNSRVMGWSFLQTIVLIASSAAQVYLLRQFFRKKKLV